MHGRAAAHHGGTDQTVVEMLRFPEEGLVVIVLANYLPAPGVSAPKVLAREAAALYFGESSGGTQPTPFERPLEDLEALTGKWEMEDGGMLVIESGEGGLWIRGSERSVFD